MLARLKAAAKRHPRVVAAVRAAYPALAWLSNRPAVYTRVAPYLREMEFDEVRLTGRGNEPEAHLCRTRRYVDVARADVLVLGAGRGEELALWRAQQPRSLTAVDALDHARHWHAVPGVRFARMDARALAFADASFDLVASTALFEHIDRVDDAAREMARVLRPGGLAFANFGPLWWTYGGAHYDGAFEHLSMDDAGLERYLLARGIPAELEDGLVWLRHGMFSRLRYDDYLRIFRRHFNLAHTVLAVSQPALRYRRQHPAAWRALTGRFAERDLLTFSMTVWMRPKAAPIALRTPRDVTPALRQPPQHASPRRGLSARADADVEVAA
ncbi:MAG TPA: class I SAM-dependent methyltransferase [Polyangia bacterium]|nr:class I SAM-dependent methyltransferase [Polyangia bacterium]